MSRPAFGLILAAVLANPTPAAQTATLTWHGKRIEIKLASQEVRLLTDSPAGETTVSPATRTADGILVNTVRSPYQSGQTEIRVLLPDRLQAGRRYRVLYVLPVEAGGESHYGDGLREAKKADLANRFGLICVEPTFAQLPWYADHPSDAGVRQESHLLRVVLPAVERTYPVAAEARGRLLVGFSKSGWGAWSLLLRHPEVFAAAGAWDAPLEESTPKRFGMGPIFGSQENFEGYRIATLLERRAELLRGRPRLVLAGYGNFRAATEAAHRRLEGLRIPHVYRDGPQRAHVWGSGWLAEVVERVAELGGTP